jgi:hypothetical protein
VSVTTNSPSPLVYGINQCHEYQKKGQETGL